MVNEKPLPGTNPNLWLSEEKVQRKGMVAYKTSMTYFEWALNSWFIPIFSAPPSIRAQAAYRATKWPRKWIGCRELLEKLDPKEAATLKRELTRPAGSLPTPEH